MRNLQYTLRVVPSHLALWLVFPVFATLLPPAIVNAAAGSMRVAAAGWTLTQQGSWPEGVADFLNHPSRTNGWNSFFSGWPSDVHQYEMHPTSMEEVNQLIARFAEIESDNLQLILTPFDEPSGYGWVGRLPEGNAIPVMFSIGDQAQIDQWYERLPDGKFGVMEFEQAPIAVPPSLTLFVGHSLIDLDQLVIPNHVQLQPGCLPTLFHKSHTKRERLAAEKPQPVKNGKPVEPEVQQQVDVIDAFIKQRQTVED